MKVSVLAVAQHFTREGEGLMVGVKRAALCEALAITHGNQTEAAKILGTYQASVCRRIDSLDVRAFWGATRSGLIRSWDDVLERLGVSSEGLRLLREVS